MPKLISVLALFLVLVFLGAGSVKAACEVSASSQYMQPNSDVSLQLNVKNTNDYALSWVNIQTAFGLMFTSVETEIQASGWELMQGGEWNTFFGGVLPPGDTLRFNVRGKSGGEEGTFSWNFAAAPGAGGDGAESCNSIDFTIAQAAPTSPPVYVPPPVISQLVVSVESTRATISWRTDVNAGSVVNYGVTSGYGSNVTDGASTQSHQIILPNLTASTTYHYQVSSGNGDGTTTTSDATFTTTAAGSTTPTTVTVTATTTSTSTSVSAPTPTPKPLVDTVPPTINVKTDFSKPFLESPTITGTSTDTGDINVGVVSLEYSLDGGKNWLPVDVINGVGKKTVSFEFMPGKLDDGNYSVKMRGKDSTGNLGVSRVKTMIIDRLPPQVGGSLFSLGPMILKPDFLGNIYSIVGLEMKMILSAVGGPTTMDLFYDSQKFPLIKNDESGLWSALIKITKAEKFPLKIDSVDGAKNATERSIGNVVALTPGKVVDENGNSVFKAKVKIYTFEKTANDFVLWESKPYMQSNPQETDNNGEYRLILPSGRYYIEVEMRGKRKLRSEIFELDVATPITQNFTLEPSFFGSWLAKVVPINLVNSEEVNRKLTNSLVGKAIPDFDLSVGENLFSNTSILGKQSVITFVTSWEPQTSDQLLTLDLFKNENEGVNVVAVITQESVSKVNIFKKIGGYKLPIVADPDGVLVMPLNLGSLPTHIFLDRKGIIKDIYVGFLDKKSLLKRILN